MPHFFISYSHIDALYVRRLAQALEQEGYSPWVDDRIDYGSTWDEEVQRRLDDCAAFILVMTPNSSASRWVKNELNRAMRKNKPIFPLLLEGDEPWLAVESIQFMDVRGGKLPDERFYQHLSKYAPREKPLQEVKPSPLRAPAEDKIQPKITVEKAIIEEFHPSRPEEIVTREISPLEIPGGKKASAELTPVDQVVEEEAPAQPVKDEQALEEKPQQVEISSGAESQTAAIPIGQGISEEIPLVKTPTEREPQIDLVPEKKIRQKKVASPRIKEESKRGTKPTKVQKARQRGAEWRKEVSRAVIAGSIMLVAAGVGGTLWAFRGPLGLIPKNEETPAFGQTGAITPMGTATVSVPTQTAIPLPGISITIENAGKVTELRRWGDEGVINQLVINSTGTRLAVGTSVGVYLFDPTTLEQLDYQDYEEDVTALAFTKEGNTLAVGLGNGAIEVKEVDDMHGEALYSLRALAAVRSLAFDPLGKYLAAGLDAATILVWSMEDGSPIVELTGLQYEVTSVVFLDDIVLASASRNGTIRLWQIPEGNEITALPGQTAGVLNLAFSLGGSTFAAGRADGSIQIWSVSERTMLYQLNGHTGSIFSVALNPAGDLLASTADDGLRLWRLGATEGEMVGFFEGHGGPAESLVFSPDGVTLFSGGTTDGTVRAWDVDSRSETGIVDQFATRVVSSALSPDGKMLVQRMGGEVQMWSFPEGTFSRVLDAAWGNNLTGFSQDGTYLASVGSMGIGKWLVSTGSWFPTYWDATEEMATQAFNPVFDKVAVGFTDGVIRIYDFQSNLLETWGTAQSGKAVRRLEYCPKASFLAASYEDGSLVIWKETGGDPKIDISFADAGVIDSMTYSASCDTLLLVGEDDKLRYLTYDSGGIADLALPGEISSISSMEFSPDGTILAIATHEYEIALLDFEKMELLNILKGHTKDITSLIFVHGEGPLFNFDGDTSLLVSTSMDGTTRLWGVGE